MQIHSFISRLLDATRSESTLVLFCHCSYGSPWKTCSDLHLFMSLVVMIDEHVAARPLLLGSR